MIVRTTYVISNHDSDLWARIFYEVIDRLIEFSLKFDFLSARLIPIVSASHDTKWHVTKFPNSLQVSRLFNKIVSRRKKDTAR